MLDNVNRLRCLSFPLHLPALALFNGPRGPVVAPLRGASCLQGTINEAFEERLDRLGRPARTSKRVTILQPGHAPHLLWLPTPLTPDVFEACELLEQTGFFSDDTVLVETSTHLIDLLGVNLHFTFFNFLHPLGVNFCHEIYTFGCKFRGVIYTPGV